MPRRGRQLALRTPREGKPCAACLHFVIAGGLESAAGVTNDPPPESLLAASAFVLFRMDPVLTEYGPTCPIGLGKECPNIDVGLFARTMLTPFRARVMVR